MENYENKNIYEFDQILTNKFKIVKTNYNNDDNGSNDELRFFGWDFNKCKCPIKFFKCDCGYTDGESLSISFICNINKILKILKVFKKYKFYYNPNRFGSYNFTNLNITEDFLIEKFGSNNLKYYQNIELLINSKNSNYNNLNTLRRLDLYKLIENVYKIIKNN